jgi:hypothetical protein
MYAININGEDFTDRLLTGNPESGLSNLSRSVEDEEDFSPVASTIDVALSDLDGKVSDFLHLPDLMELNAAPDGNLPSFHVEIFDDDGKFFGGYIEPETFGGCPLNPENLNEESVVRFTVADYTKELFRQLGTKYWEFGRTLGASNPIKVSAPGYRPGNPPTPRGSISRYSQDYQNHWYLENDYVSIIPLSEFLQTILERDAIIDSMFSNLYISNSVIDALTGRQVANLSMSTRASLLLDVAKSLVALMSVGENNQLTFTRWNSYNADLEPAVIENYITVETSPYPSRNAEFVRDIAWDYIAYTGGDVLRGSPAECPRLTAHYYFDYSQTPPVLSQMAGDAKPLGKTMNLVPSFASEMNALEYIYLYWEKRPDGNYYSQADLSVERTAMIVRLLTSTPKMKIRCPGTRFYPGQAVVINGLEGWRILSANIEPMQEESDLLAEYRGK